MNRLNCVLLRYKSTGRRPPSAIFQLAHTVLWLVHEPLDQAPKISVVFVFVFLVNTILSTTETSGDLLHHQVLRKLCGRKLKWGGDGPRPISTYRCITLTYPVSPT